MKKLGLIINSFVLSSKSLRKIWTVKHYFTLLFSDLFLRIFKKIEYKLTSKTQSNKRSIISGFSFRNHLHLTFRGFAKSKTSENLLLIFIFTVLFYGDSTKFLLFAKPLLAVRFYSFANLVSFLYFYKLIKYYYNMSTNL